MKFKKELKNIYKEMKFKIGVFQIRNTINNKIYIDSSTDLKAIWNRHKFQLNNGFHPNKALQKDWKEFGEKKFLFEILIEIKEDNIKRDKDYHKDAKQLALMFIEELQPFDDKGYNIKQINRP